MKRLAEWALGIADAIGGPGLFLVAYLDSSFLSLPQANDLLIVAKVALDKPRMAYYAGLATLGSVLGCLTLYAIARAGGEAVLRRRVSEARMARLRESFERYGMLALVVPALLPPPAPFKLFVLMAGVAGMSVSRFVAALVVGRGTRYFGIGFLTVRYGDAAMDVLREHGRAVAYGVAALVLLLAVWWAWAHRAPPAAEER